MDAMNLTGFLAHADADAFSAYLCDQLVDAHASDEEGSFWASDLEIDTRKEFIEMQVSTPYLMSKFLDSYIEASGLSQEILVDLRKRFTIRYDDACECPICTPNSNGLYKEDTLENRTTFGCLLADIPMEVQRIAYFVSLASSSDPLRMPLWLYQAYRVAEETRWVAEGKRAKQARVEREKRERKRKQEERTKSRNKSRSPRVIPR